MWAFQQAWNRLPRWPQARARRVARVLSDLAWLRNGKGVRQLQRNLGRVVATDDQALRDLTRQALRKYADYWRQMFQQSAWTIEECEARVVLHDFDRIDAALADGRGAIVASHHSGNWDLAGTVVARRFGGVTTVAERLKPEALFELFLTHRASLGMEIVPHRGGPRPPFEVLAERLREGKLVALVSDRDLSRRGVPVDFFDARASMAAGPAALAVATGAALVPCAVWVEGETVHARAHQPLEVLGTGPDEIARLTQRLADVYARDIAAHPTDWHMLQPVWLEDARR